MRIVAALRELHRSESALADELLRVADRHSEEPEVRHVAEDLAYWSREHAHEITEVMPRYRSDPAGLAHPEPAEEDQPELPGEEGDADLALLADLRRVYRMSAGVALDWDLLGQGAHVVADADLLAATERCRARAERQMRWARGMLKALSPQILAT
ncbi:hypothetical protein [Nocardiopsis xinjiangensis]|uniref:hypothetical protein n=1 Tax=Nocardiopsis xinjiangensis TaxID=124285 RepID=UPI000346EDC7|nr:hypothetical protein [Nocardiopsis xinjiangensis]